VIRAFNWLNSLSPLIFSIGEPAFSNRLLSVLNTVLAIDVIAVFLVNRPGELEYLFSASERSPSRELSQMFSAQYAESDWKSDPAMSANLGNYRPRPITLTRQLIDVLPRGRYRRNWEVMNALDRISIWGSVEDTHVLLHAYRLGESGPFSRQDLDLLPYISDFSADAISKHCMISHRSGRPNHPSILDVMEDIAAWNGKLSPREGEICALMVLGKSDKQIAQETGIKLSSVITYRKRAFNKLDVANRGDLTNKYWRLGESYIGRA
jgi:DNA-binding CsgD family transcriptional regulator